MNTIALPTVEILVSELQQIRFAADWKYIIDRADHTAIETAWNQLPVEEQTRITEIVNENRTPTPQEMAILIAECETPEQLTTLKEDFGEFLIKAAWKLIPKERRDELTRLCAPEPQPKPKTLLDLGAELERLEELLEELLEDEPNAIATIDELLALKSETEQAYSDKIDNYAALIQQRRYQAEARSQEARRLDELAQRDRKLTDLLTERLKAHLQSKGTTRIATKRYNLCVANNGGLQPIAINVEVESLPQRFQKLRIEADKAALREALETGDPEAATVASFSDRGTHLRIK